MDTPARDVDAAPRTEDGQEPLGRQVSRMLFELVGVLRHHLEDVAASADLTAMQARALYHLDVPCPMGDVAERLGCDASNVTGIVDRLEERGLVERRQDDQDRRRRLLVTTDGGHEVRGTLMERMRSGHPILVGLSPAEQSTLRDLLAKALAAAGAAQDNGAQHTPAQGTGAQGTAAQGTAANDAASQDAAVDDAASART